MQAFKKVDKRKEVKKLNKKVIETIMNTLRRGSYIETAVVLAGVSKQRFYDWIKLAHQDRKEKKANTIYIK